jgi:hypothetical protein
VFEDFSTISFVANTNRPLGSSTATTPPLFRKIRAHSDGMQSRIPSSGQQYWPRKISSGGFLFELIN